MAIINKEIQVLALKGDKGFSPTATVTKSGNTATITLTDKNGTTTATVSDGEPTWGQISGDIYDQADLEDRFYMLHEQISNVERDLTVVDKSITLNANSWVQSNNVYYYEIRDSTVQVYHQINGYMDLDNQTKIKDGYIETGGGYYRIYTSKRPTENITMTVTRQKVTGSW